MGIDINDDNFKQEVLEEKLPVLVDFWAVWWGQSLRNAVVIEHIAEKYKDRVKVCKLNVNDASRIASEYGMTTKPALAVFKGGRLIDRIDGGLSAVELEGRVEKFI